MLFESNNWTPFWGCRISIFYRVERQLYCRVIIEDDLSTFLSIYKYLYLFIYGNSIKIGERNYILSRYTWFFEFHIIRLHLHLHNIS